MICKGNRVRERFGLDVVPEFEPLSGGKLFRVIQAG